MLKVQWPNQSLKLTEPAVDDLARAKRTATVGRSLPRADWLPRRRGSPPHLSSGPLAGKASITHRLSTISYGQLIPHTRIS